MRSRILSLAGVLALIPGVLLLAPATPAMADPGDPAHCSEFGSHPDLYNGGGISFANGTIIHSGAYTDCNPRGEGFPSQGINVHCAVVNDNGFGWFFVVDTSTGISGWGRTDAFNYAHSVSVPIC